MNTEKLIDQLDFILGCVDMDEQEFQDLLALIKEVGDARYNQGYDAGRADYEITNTDGLAYRTINQEGYDEGYEDGKDEGHSDGYQQGYDDGYKAGTEEVL